MNGCAPGLALIERLKATRKWAIDDDKKWYKVPNPLAHENVRLLVKPVLPLVTRMKKQKDNGERSFV